MTDPVTYKELGQKFDEFRKEMQKGFSDISKQIESVRESTVSKEMFELLLDRIACNEREAKDAEDEITSHTKQLADHESRIGHAELLIRLVTGAVVTGLVGAILALILK